VKQFIILNYGVHVGRSVFKGCLDLLKGNRLFIEMRGREIFKNLMMKDGYLM
jgi:hypothetical protein